MISLEETGSAGMAKNSNKAAVLKRRKAEFSRAVEYSFDPEQIIQRAEKVIDPYSKTL